PIWPSDERRGAPAGGPRLPSSAGLRSRGATRGGGDDRPHQPNPRIITMTPDTDAEFEAERIGSPSRARRIDVRRTLYSFRHAGRGFAWALTSQANLRVHFAAAAVVLVAALVLRFSTIDFVGLILCFAIVGRAELFNTAVQVLIEC